MFCNQVRVSTGERGNACWETVNMFCSFCMSLANVFVACTLALLVFHCVCFFYLFDPTTQFCLPFLQDNKNNNNNKENNMNEYVCKKKKKSKSISIVRNEVNYLRTYPYVQYLAERIKTISLDQCINNEHIIAFLNRITICNTWMRIFVFKIGKKNIQKMHHF